VRLNKYIALCGAASRRGADKLIAEGKVTVNGENVTTMGPDIDEAKDVVTVNGVRISPEKDNVYIMLNKPAGVISSCHDDRGRKTVVDLVKGMGKRVYPAGRLDYDTEGLLILTSDGRFAYKCTHPKHEVYKKYFAEVDGPLDGKAIKALRRGVVIDGRATSKAEVDILGRKGGITELYITIHEGRNRQIKKMMESIGCSVRYLKRISIGELELGDLPLGKWRELSAEDIILLGIED
jgi:pseudouridine synthase